MPRSPKKKKKKKKPPTTTHGPAHASHTSSTAIKNTDPPDARLYLSRLDDRLATGLAHTPAATSSTPPGPESSAEPH